MTLVKTPPQPPSPPKRLADAIAITGASKAAVVAVLDLLRDGVPRIDEEIADAIRKWSPATIRHARLALFLAGEIRWAGEAKRTAYNKLSYMWKVR